MDMDLKSNPNIWIWISKLFFIKNMDLDYESDPNIWFWIGLPKIQSMTTLTAYLVFLQGYFHFLPFLSKYSIWSSKH